MHPSHTLQIAGSGVESLNKPTKLVYTAEEGLVAVRNRKMKLLKQLVWTPCLPTEAIGKFLQKPMASTAKPGLGYASRGFTLLELMIVVAVAAILGTIAVPSFETFIKNNRIVTQTNDFFGDLNYARVEAIKRNTNVNLCKSSDGSTCDGSGANWAIGWIVYWDTNNSRALDTAETILRKHASLSPNTSLDVAATSQLATQIVFTSNGQAYNDPATIGTGNEVKDTPFYLCDDRGPSQGRSIQIEVTGRPSISRGNLATCTP